MDINIRVAETHEGGIDTVHTRAGHQTDIVIRHWALLAVVRDGRRLRTLELFKFLQDGFGRGHELLAVLFINGLCIRQVDGAWVTVHAVQAIFVMQMVGGG